LLPDSSEFHWIKVLRKRAKHFWRRVVAGNGANLLDKIQALMRSFGSTLAINLA
jgi:hypothetical protein